MLIGKTVGLNSYGFFCIRCIGYHNLDYLCGIKLNLKKNNMLIQLTSFDDVDIMLIECNRGWTLDEAFKNISIAINEAKEESDDIEAFLPEGCTRVYIDTLYINV